MGKKQKFIKTWVPRDKPLKVGNFFNFITFCTQLLSSVIPWLSEALILMETTYRIEKKEKSSEVSGPSFNQEVTVI